MAPATEVNMTPDAAAPAAAAKPADAPAAEKPAESTDASPPADAAPLDKFSGAPGEDYIQWRVRVEARLRSSGLWPVAEGAASAPSSSAARALVISALAGDALTAAGDGGGPRELLTKLDDAYIPKRRKTTFAERFAADPTHFETFRNMLNDASSGSDDDDFKIENEEEEEEFDSDIEPLVPEGEVAQPDDGYVSAEDEDYVVDDAKLVEDAKDEDPEQKEVVKDSLDSTM